MLLKLVEFINNNPWDWEQKLTEKPYCITIKRKDDFVMFNYSQLDSDFYNPIVKECRGLILYEPALRPVCVPFYKFGNYGEGYVDTIDWNSARVQEKVDGSIIKVWCFDDIWHVSTNGNIDANDAPLACDICIYDNFFQLYYKAASLCKLDYDRLDKDCTYMFELISPFNRVVVPYTNIEIVHIGTRNNITLEELDIDIGIRKPKTYGFTSLDECTAMAAMLPFSDEGYVVVDKDWHRNKIKSPAYVAAHYLKNNGMVTKARIVAIIRQNQDSEFVTYYPEYKEAIDDILNKIKTFCNDMDWCIETARFDMKFENRKRFAEFALTTRCPAMMFSWFDNKICVANQWLWSQTDDKIIEWIERK